jgi:hypothetical protein
VRIHQSIKIYKPGAGLTPVILVTRESEMRGLRFEASLGK